MRDSNSGDCDVGKEESDTPFRPLVLQLASLPRNVPSHLVEFETPQ